MKAEGGRMKDEKEQGHTNGQVVFILPPSSFILIFKIAAH